MIKLINDMFSNQNFREDNGSFKNISDSISHPASIATPAALPTEILVSSCTALASYAVVFGERG